MFDCAPIDDAGVETPPEVCVDYLSHNWAVEDVWRSWRAVTKKKHEVENGVRLENASWRTWAKQRSNLPTVCPEALNWLKDSDVTWLYGPLHEHPAVPPPRAATLSERFGLDPPPTAVAASEPCSPRSGLALAHAGFGGYTNASGKKSILKHRTIGELFRRDSASWLSDDSESTDLASPSFSDRAHACRPRHRIKFNARVDQCIALPESDDEPLDWDEEEEVFTIAPLAPTRLKPMEDDVEIIAPSSGGRWVEEDLRGRGRTRNSAAEWEDSLSTSPIPHDPDDPLAQKAREKYMRATQAPRGPALVVDVSSHPGPTPGNTPVWWDEADGGSPIIPRRTGATGAVVAPKKARLAGSLRTRGEQDTIAVPLAADYVSEDEGGLVARAAEMVNTARDLWATLWGATASGWRE